MRTPRPARTGQWRCLAPKHTNRELPNLARWRLRAPEPTVRPAARKHMIGPPSARNPNRLAWSVNLKTAEALGLTVRQTLLARPDENLSKDLKGRSHGCSHR